MSMICGTPFSELLSSVPYDPMAVAQQNKALPRPGNRTRTNRTFVLPEYTYEDSEIHHSVGNSARVWGPFVIP
jgi:hypothetical protein